MTKKWSKAFWRDWGERVGSVAVYQLIVLVTNYETIGLDLSKLWPLLGLPVVLAALKGIAANLKNPESGASLLNPPPSV